MKPSNLTHLDDKKMNLLLYCGKGGVGKTTCSAATALHFADLGLKTFLISSDPAPSLSDILEIKCGSIPEKVPSAKNLEVVELRPEHTIEMWKKKYGMEVYEVISSFLPVDKDIIDYIAGAPGIDEEFMLSYVYDLLKENRYDVMVWDTAPAGGTLNLIRLEEKFYTHLGEAAKMYLRVKGALDKLAGASKRNPLEVVEEWRTLAKNILDMLRGERTEAMMVTIPEALSVYQTNRVMHDLNEFGIRMGKIVVNQVFRKDVCDCTFHASRVEMQQKYLNMLAELFGEDRLVVLPMQPFEVKGVDALRKVSKHLFQ